MTLRSRLALLCAGAVAIGVVAASVAAWVVTRQTMRAQIDEALAMPMMFRAAVSAPGTRTPPEGDVVQLTEPGALTDRLCTETPVVPAEGETLIADLQLILPDGTVCSPGRADLLLEPTAEERAVAGSDEGEVLRDGYTTSGEHVRVLTRPAEDGAALQTVRSLEEVDATSARLGWILGAASLLGVLLAALAGRAGARSALRPVERLTAATERIASTDDLEAPLDTDESRPRDEVSRLTSSFNAMVARLADSRRRQQQLVADASHELRTPMTSLRTNVEWLMRGDDHGRPPTGEERRRIETAVLGQVDELAHLVGELGEVARGGERRTAVPLDLGEVALRAVERAQRRDPGRRFDLDLDPAGAPAAGDPAALERAVLNLLDNALKFSAAPIGVTVRREGVGVEVAVADRGPGLTEDEREAAFARFWRAPGARELPGSGLGLAIVHDVARAHGGRAFFRPRPGGGSVVGFTVAAS